ncbi:hypothetical protein PHLGIDRAFT_18577 [Phlebiopsis gigantea 11061_1 CR5-6]|uniref:RRM domain-containing protein n=1 Tax=Phlebiopsis gigantea (strain 11061_1 CR5-6) TaxID=745531 RepID=A0A0C3NW32_PHLG1|nr:hypothetical protein PHLGIDRAFT_18577 [Phlebiopsis gigantea 11061_1 CR5-6]
MSQLASAASKAARAAARALQTETRRTIEIRGLPKTALPSDVRRLCVGARVENIASVAIDYDRFIPSGSAWVTVTNPIHLRKAVQNLHGAVIAGHPVSAAPVSDTGRDAVSRMRGARGREEAAQRGVINGNGPNGGVTGGGKNVVIYGLPGKMTEEATGYFLQSFKLAGSADDKDIVKLDVPLGALSLTSKFFVRLETEAEAYRLVRKLHETYYEPDVFDKRYRVRAQVIH